MLWVPVVIRLCFYLYAIVCGAARAAYEADSLKQALVLSTSSFNSHYYNDAES